MSDGRQCNHFSPKTVIDEKGLNTSYCFSTHLNNFEKVLLSLTIDSRMFSISLQISLISRSYETKSIFDVFHSIQKHLFKDWEEDLLFKKKTCYKFSIFSNLKRVSALTLEAMISASILSPTSHAPTKHIIYIFYFINLVLYASEIKKIQRTSKCLISSMRTSLGYQQLLLMACGINIVDIHASTKAFI